VALVALWSLDKYNASNNKALYGRIWSRLINGLADLRQVKQEFVKILRFKLVRDQKSWLLVRGLKILRFKLGYKCWTFNKYTSNSTRIFENCPYVFVTDFHDFDLFGSIFSWEPQILHAYGALAPLIRLKLSRYAYRLLTKIFKCIKLFCKFQINDRIM
jgi:hypothetical protein